MKFIIAIIVFMFSFNAVAANKAAVAEKPNVYLTMEENQIQFFTKTLPLLAKCKRVTLVELREQTKYVEDDRTIYAYKCSQILWYGITKNTK